MADNQPIRVVGEPSTSNQKVYDGLLLEKPAYVGQLPVYPAKNGRPALYPAQAIKASEYPTDRESPDPARIVRCNPAQELYPSEDEYPSQPQYPGYPPQPQYSVHPPYLQYPPQPHYSAQSQYPEQMQYEGTSAQPQYSGQVVYPPPPVQGPAFLAPVYHGPQPVAFIVPAQQYYAPVPHQPAHLNISSGNFDPVAALQSETFGMNVAYSGHEPHDLNELQDMVEGQQMNLPPGTVQGNVAPPNTKGGIPMRNKPKPQNPYQASRRDEVPVQRAPKAVPPNVLQRMRHNGGTPDKICILGLLKESMDKGTRVKIYTRNDRGIRSVISAIVIAFDKHFNMILRDVVETFISKHSYKSPILEDDLSSFQETEEFAIPGDRGNQNRHPPVLPAQPGDTKTTMNYANENYEVRGKTLKEAKPSKESEESRDVETLNRSLRLYPDFMPYLNDRGMKRRRKVKRSIRQRRANKILMRGEHVVLVACSDKRGV